MVRIENPIRRLTKGNTAPVEASLAPTPDWRWCVNHAFEGPNQRSVFLTRAIDGALRKVAEQNPQVANQCERVLPVSIAFVSQLSNELAPFIRELNPVEVINEVRQIDGSLPEDQRFLHKIPPKQLDELVKNFITDFEPFKPFAQVAERREGRVGEFRGNMADGIKIIAERLGLSTSPVPAYADSVNQSLYPWEKNDQRLVKMAGLLDFIPEAKRYHVGLALVGGTIFLALSVVAGSAGAGERGLPTAIGMFGVQAVESLVLARILSSDLKDYYDQKKWPALILGAIFIFGFGGAMYGFDARSLWQGLPELGFTDRLARILFTIGGVVAPELCFSYAASEIETGGEG